MHQQDAGATLERTGSQRGGVTKRKERQDGLALFYLKIAYQGTRPASRKTEGYHLARMRYLRTEVPSLATGTLNWAAQAAVLVNLYVEESISQSPPMGSLTSTVMGESLWLRRVI